MKVLIWIGCLILNYIFSIIASAIVSLIPAVNTQAIAVISLVSGLLVAASFGISCWLAIKLCKKWDWNQVEKKAAEAGMTVSEYGKHRLSEKFLAKLEELCNTIPFEQVKSQLKTCMKKGIITKEQYIILLEEYSTKK